MLQDPAFEAFAAQDARFTVIGESLVDVIIDPDTQTRMAHPGGSPMNVAVGCARLGLATDLITHYADDPDGRLLDEHLQCNQVSVLRGGTAATSNATATVGDDGSATYVFNVTWDIHGASLPALASVQAATHVHTGSIATVLPPGDDSCFVLLQAAKGHATISYDPNCRPAITPDVDAARRQAEMFVSASDIVKASDEDLKWLYPHRTPEESLAAWLQLGPAIAALTQGATGPVMLTRHGRVETLAEEVTVADTVGAGDAFMAALIAGLATLGALGAAGRQRAALARHGVAVRRADGVASSPQCERVSPSPFSF